MTDTQPSGAESALDLDKLEALARGVPEHIQLKGWFAGAAAFGDRHVYADDFKGQGRQHIASIPADKKYFGTLADFIAAANPATVLALIALIALARRATAPHAGPAPADECGANMNGHRFGPHGRKGEQQCEWCGAAQPFEAGSAVQDDQLNAARFRWLNADHDDVEVRELARDLAKRLGTSSYFAITRDIDAAMAAAPAEPVGGALVASSLPIFSAEYIEKHKLAVTTDWANGWDSCIHAHFAAPATGALVAKAEPVAWYADTQYDLNEDKQHGEPDYRNHRVVTLGADKPKSIHSWKPLFDTAPIESAAAPADDFARGVIAALGVLNAHGYPHGSVYHDEIVQSVGEASIYAAAEEDDYRWAGLDPAKKPSATQQPTTQGEKS